MTETAHSLESRQPWQEIGTFTNLLDGAFNQAENLADACQVVLNALLEHSRREAGFLWVQTPLESRPYLVTSQGLSSQQVDQLEIVNESLYQLVQGVVRSGEAAQDDKPMGVGVVLPITFSRGLQGCLGILGDPPPAETIESLAALLRLAAHWLHHARHGWISPSGYVSPRSFSEVWLDNLYAMQNFVAGLSLHYEYSEVQESIISGTRRLLDVETCALVLVDDDNKTLITKKAQLGSGEWVYQVDQKIGDSLVLGCLNAQQPFLTNNAAADPRFNTQVDSIDGVQTRNMIGVPLILNDEAVGLIEVINKRSGDFADYDRELLVLITKQVGQAIYGMRLIQQLKVANADLEASHWELLRSRNTLRALFDSIPAALYIIDNRYKLMAINVSCAQRASKAPKVLVGQQCYEALYSRSEVCPGCRVAETLFSGQNTSRTERRWGTEEEPAEWEVSTYPIMDEADQVVQAIVLEQDVTEKRRLESIIAQSEKLAAVGQLAAGVAHEINNPLTAIIANAQILQRELPPDDDLQESIDLIARAGARATQVVRNLLDFARKEQYNLALTNVNETIQRSLALVQHEILARSITLTFEMALDLPLIMASQDHLQGVWLNLLLNAIDAIDNKQGKLKVTTRRTANDVRISFADNGKGIPPEKISRIFEPFFTTKAPGRGTGLGLSVCHRIIKQHGGHILVQSQVGIGTEFTVVLPIR